MCASLSLYCKFGYTALMSASEGGHTAIVELLLGAGADTEAKDRVSERKRENYTHTLTHMVDKMVWRRKHHVASLPIVLAEVSSTCSQGPGLNSAIFFLFFFRCDRALRGVPNARRTHFSFRIMRLFSLRRVARVKRGAENALERFDELQKEVKKAPFFCWKCTILTRCLNRVGFEFWDLSRNHNGHILAVKCCRIIDLSSGTPWIWN